MPGLPEPIQRLLERPAVAHLQRTNERFNARLGAQGSAAAAYFSVLTLVPLLSLAFSVVGFLLTVVRPDLRDDVAAAVTDRIGTGATAQQILSLINDALANYAGVASCPSGLAGCSSCTCSPCCPNALPTRAPAGGER